MQNQKNWYFLTPRWTILHIITKQINDFTASPPYLSSLPFLLENRGGNCELFFPCVQIGTLTMGLILILVVDLVLSNPFFILLACFSLFPLDPSLPSAIGGKSPPNEHEEEDDEEEEDGDRDDGRCFLSLISSFHKTVHLGGLGDGSSSTNQLVTLVALSSLCWYTSLIFSTSSFSLRLTFSSFSEFCTCQKGSSFPSKNSSSADSIVVWLVTLPERNSNSPARGDLSLSGWLGDFGLKETKFLSSAKSPEKDIRGLEFGSTDLGIA